MARIGLNGDAYQMFETRLGILVRTLIWKTSKHGQRGAILLGGRELVRGLRDADVSPLSPSLQISLDLCLVCFVGVALFGWCVGLVGFCFRGNLSSFFTHSSG